MKDKLTIEQMRWYESTRLQLREHEFSKPVIRGDEAVRAAALRMVQRMAASYSRTDETRFAPDEVSGESEGTDRPRNRLYS